MFFLQTNALVPDPVSTRVLLRISYEPEVEIWLESDDDGIIVASTD